MYSLGPGAAVGKKLQKLEVQGTKVGERGELGSRLGKEKGAATLSPLFNHQFFFILFPNCGAWFRAIVCFAG